MEEAKLEYSLLRFQCPKVSERPAVRQENVALSVVGLEVDQVVDEAVELASA